MKDKIITSANRKILFLPHAIKQMSGPDRMISIDEIKECIFNGEIIEEYANDPRGESCLIAYRIKSRFIHVVCSPKKDYLAIITTYIPNKDQWLTDCKTRK